MCIYVRESRAERRRLCPWRSFDPEVTKRVNARGAKTPDVFTQEKRSRAIVCQKHDLAVIVVGGIVAVAMQGPEEIFLKAMGMAVIGNHFQMIIDRLKHFRSVGRRGRDGPDHEREAKQPDKNSSRLRSHSSHQRNLLYRLEALRKLQCRLWQLACRFKVQGVQKALDTDYYWTTGLKSSPAHEAWAYSR